jgi:branched-chain amino acid transport system substrate-binding protein
MSTAAAQNSGTIKVGVLTALSGPAAAIGTENLNGMRYAVEEGGGAVAGNKIELLVADDQNTPNVGLTEARRLIDKENVAAIMGTLNSASALAISPYTTRAEVPFIFGGIASELTGARKSEFSFRSSYSSGQLESPIVQFIDKRNLKKGILIGSDNAAGRDSLKVVGDTIKRLGGTVVEEMYPRQGETDYAPYLARIGDKDADYVYGYFFGGDILRFVQAYKSFGIKNQLVITVSALSSGGVAKALGANIDGVMSVELWVWTLQDPASKSFVEGYTKAFGAAPQTIAYDGYIKGRVMVEALKAVKGNVTDRTALAKAIKVVRFPIPGGEFRFDENNNPVVTARLVQWSWRDGDAVPNLLDTLEGLTQAGQPR